MLTTVILVHLLGLQLLLTTPLNGNDDVTLADRLTAMEVKIRNQEATIGSLQTQVRDLKQQLDEKDSFDDDTVSSRVARTPNVNVAFSAYLDHRVEHVGIDSIIPFNKVILNDGNAFNKFTGIFTVPTSGVYLFTYSINTVVDAYQLVVKLVVDGVNVSDGTSDPFHNLQEVQGGNTILVRVNQGQSVWLAAYNTGNTVVDGREDYRFTTFSGVLLYS